jgi:hypothetical protein
MVATFVNPMQKVMKVSEQPCGWRCALAGFSRIKPDLQSINASLLGRCSLADRKWHGLCQHRSALEILQVPDWCNCESHTGHRASSCGADHVCERHAMAVHSAEFLLDSCADVSVSVSFEGQRLRPDRSFMTGAHPPFAQGQPTLSPEPVTRPPGGAGSWPPASFETLPAKSASVFNISQQDKP